MSKPWMETAIAFAFNIAACFVVDRGGSWLAGLLTGLAVVQWIIWRARQRMTQQHPNGVEGLKR